MDNTVLREIVENSPDGIGICDPDGYFIFLNQKHCKIHGYNNMSELIGSSWEVLYDAPEVDKIKKTAFPKLEQDGSWSDVLPARRKDGSRFLERVSLSTISHGRILCICGVVTESQLVASGVSENIRQREMLMDKKTQLFSLASHELRNLISGTLVSAEMIDDHSVEVDPRERNEIAAQLTNQLRQTTQVLDRFLTLGRHFAGVLEFKPERVNLRELLLIWEDSGWWNLDTEGNRVVTTIAKSVNVTAQIDKFLLQHALINLLTNSLKYSYPDTEVGLFVQVVDSCAKFIIEDKGPGFSGEVESPFNPFNRLSSSHENNTSGTGLGLFLVRECARIHQGTIQIDTSYKLGARIEMFIPIGGRSQKQPLP